MRTILTLTYIGASENFAGMHDRALQTLQQVPERNPASAEAWYLICQVYSYLGRYDDARRAIDRTSALALEAGFAPLHALYRGLAEFLAGEYSTATPLLERKAVEQPDYGYVNILSAICVNFFGLYIQSRLLYCAFFASTLCRLGVFIQPHLPADGRWQSK